MKSAGSQPTGCVRDPFRLTALGYLRVSKDEQDLGIDAQAATLDAFVRQHAMTQRDTFVDHSSGGLRLERRPILLEAIAALRKGEVLLVARRDRLGRDPFELCMVDRLVHKQKARVVSVAGQGCGLDDDPADLNHIVTRRLFDAFGEYERLATGLRTKNALGVLKAHGLRTGTLPFGFALDADGKHLVEAPIEQRLRTTILELAKTLHSRRAICDAINESGYTTRKGTPWRPAYIARFLRKVAG